VLDADLGILLSLAWYEAGRPLTRQELREVSPAEPEKAPDFDADVPPGVRVIEDPGDPFRDSEAPELVKFISRAASGAARWASRLRG
jgi:hypothetical protein